MDHFGIRIIFLRINARFSWKQFDRSRHQEGYNSSSAIKTCLHLIFEQYRTRYRSRLVMRISASISSEFQATFCQYSNDAIKRTFRGHIYEFCNCQIISFQFQYVRDAMEITHESSFLSAEKHEHRALHAAKYPIFSF